MEDDKGRGTKEEGHSLTSEEEKKVLEIEKRWQGTVPVVLCEECINDALRHKRRNSERYCCKEDSDEIHHQEAEDEYSEAFAYSPKDIQTLLAIIFRLTDK